MINLIAAILCLIACAIYVDSGFYAGATFHALLFFLNTVLFAVEEIKDHITKSKPLT